MGNTFVCSSLEVILVLCPIIFGARREPVTALLYVKIENGRFA
jgi:hypothetical protein